MSMQQNLSGGSENPQTNLSDKDVTKEKLESPEEVKIEKKKPTIKIVDLKDKNQNPDSDSESPEEISTPLNVAYEKPSGFFTFYNMTRLMMDFVMK